MTDYFEQSFPYPRLGLEEKTYLSRVKGHLLKWRIFLRPDKSSQKVNICNGLWKK
jgi:hypothetical protein